MYRRLIPLAVVTFVTGTDSFVVAGVLPQISHALNVSIGSAGQLVTAYALTYALFAPVVAVVAARWPRRNVLLAGLSFFVLANVGAALAPDFGLVLACRILAGLGGASVTPVALAAGASLVPPEKRATALAIVGGGISASAALGVPLGAAIGGLTSWRGTMWFVAALGAVAVLGIGAFMRDVPPAPVLRLRQRLAPLTDPRVTMVLLTSLLVFTGNFTLNTYVSQAFLRVTSGKATTLALLLLLSGLAGVAGSLGSGPLTDRFGSSAVFNVAVVVSIVNFALLPWTGGQFGLACVAVIIWGVFGFSQLVPQQHRLVQISPQSAPLAISLNSSVVYIGAALSGVVGAVALHVAAARYIGEVGAALFLLGLIASQFAAAIIKRRSGEPAPAPSGTPASLSDSPASS